MTYITIRLDDDEPDTRNRIDVDLSDFDDDICDYVRDSYDIDLQEDFDDMVVNHVRDEYDIELGEISEYSTSFIFTCKNLADESLMKDLIEKYDLKRLLA
jgi:hypothetical protein